MTYADVIGSLQAASLRERYTTGCLTAEVVVGAVYDRIDTGSVDNVWTYLVPRDEAVRVARELPARFRGADLPTLYGLPFAVKDNIDVAGLPTTAAFAPARRIAEVTAACVQPLLEAGAILIGKTNLDQFATGLSGTRSPYGVPTNPLDPELIPGGSSSGSAVAVSGGLVTFAVGTDTAGSGRVPAAMTNIVGVKPSRGLVSTAGMVPACASIDCPSVFALTVADASQVLDIMAGTTTRPRAARTLRGVRLAVPRSVDLGFAPGDTARQRWAEVLESLADQGVEFDEIAMVELFEAGEKLYGGAWAAERHAAIAQHAGAAWDEVHPVVRAAVSHGPDVTAADVFADVKRIAEIRTAFQPVLDRCAALLTPTVARTFTVSELLAEPVARNAELGRFTLYGNLLDLAAIAVPAGFDTAGRPFGVTVTAASGSDDDLADLARSLEGVTGSRLGATSFTPVSTRSSPTPQGVALAVVGAHLSGMPLNGDLLALGAEFEHVTTTASSYRLFALPGTVPEKPGMVRVAPGDERGVAIEVEVYRLAEASLGALLTTVSPPLAIGSIELADGSVVHGFVCESYALASAVDISAYGGWRAYRAGGRSQTTSSTCASAVMGSPSHSTWRP